MELNQDEKRVLNTLFTGLRGTTRNEMLMTLYAAKPEADSRATISASSTQEAHYPDYLQ